MDLLGALATFVRVTETGSFSAVARETEASHSAVTRVVAQLEDHFGVRLFHRTTRRLTLTDDGQQLLSHARQLTEMAEEMDGSLGRQRSSPSGVVRLGAPVAALGWLSRRLPELQQRHAGLRIDLVISDRFGDLLEDQLDLALIAQEPPESSVVTRTLGAFGRIPVASATYLERHGAPAHPADLANHVCIIHAVGPDSAQWRFTGPDGEITVEVSAMLRSNNSEAVRRMALAGYGIARMSELQVLDDIRASRLYRLLPDYAPAQQQIYVVYPSRRHLAPRVRVAIDFLVEQVRLNIARLEQGRVWGENESAWLV